jgi:hypothetical protein
MITVLWKVTPHSLIFRAEEWRWKNMDNRRRGYAGICPSGSFKEDIE